MKSYIYLIAALYFITLFCACERNYTLTTQIHPDGSCFRQCSTAALDSAFLAGNTTNNPFPFQLSAEWQLTVSDSSGATQPWPLKKWQPKKNNPLQIVATRQFPSVQALNKDFRFNNGAWQNIIPEITFEKSFRWFYTYYKFTENYLQFPAQEIPVPLNSYLTHQEQILWFQQVPAAYEGMNGYEIYEQLNKIQEKAEKWTNHNLFVIAYECFRDFSEQQPQNPFKSRLEQARDSIFEQNKNQYDPGTTVISTLLDRYFQTSYFSELYKQNQTLIDSLCDEKQLQLTQVLDLQFKYELIMPGKVISSNAPYYENNRLIWNLNAWRFLPSDYTLSAESRKLNLWTVILTFIFAGIVIYPIFRSRKRH